MHAPTEPPTIRGQFKDGTEGSFIVGSEWTAVPEEYVETLRKAFKAHRKQEIGCSSSHPTWTTEVFARGSETGKKDVYVTQMADCEGCKGPLDVPYGRRLKLEPSDTEENTWIATSAGDVFSRVKRPHRTGYTTVSDPQMKTYYPRLEGLDSSQPE